jgi:hypothetical protein
MPNDDRAGAGILEHCGAHVSGKRAGAFGAARFPSDCDPAGGKQSKTSAGGREALTVLAIVSISHRWVAKPFIFQFPAISGLIFA